MKKTLVALAALAATGASFAQVTISGNLTAGYQQTRTNTYAGGFGAAPTATQDDASGFGVETAVVNFTAKEDLGGGQSVQAELGLVNMVRGGADGTRSTVTGALSGSTYTGAFGPGDAKLSYTNNSIGKFEFGTTRASAVHSGIPSVGAPTIAFDGKLFKNLSNSDYVSYTVAAGPLVAIAKMGENAADGIGAGQSGAPGAIKQRNVDGTLAYIDGPIKALVNYVTYDNRDEGSINRNGLTLDTTMAVQASYDFGVAKLGFGYVTAKASVGPVLNDMLIGLNVPVGALDIGLTWGQEAVSGLADVPNAKTGNATNLSRLDGTATGWSLGARYNMSKRTSFTVNTAQWTRGGYPSFQEYGARAAAVGGGAGVVAGSSQAGYGPVESQTNILLSHSF